MRRQGREIAAQEFAVWIWTLVTSRQNTMLRLIDLRGDSCARLGAPTDTASVRNQGAGRTIAKFIHAGQAEFDGIVYASRLTGKLFMTCMAVQRGVSVRPELPDI